MSGFDDSVRRVIAEQHDEIAALRRENKQLRELVKTAWRCIHTGLSCSDCRLIAGGCTLQSSMRELRIEVQR